MLVLLCFKWEISRFWVWVTPSLCFLHAIITSHQFLPRQMFTCSSGVTNIPVEWCHMLMDTNRNATLPLFPRCVCYFSHPFRLYWCERINLQICFCFLSFSCQPHSHSSNLRNRSCCSNIQSLFFSFVSTVQTAARAPMLCLVSAVWPAEPVGAGLSGLGCSWSRVTGTGSGGVSACGGGGGSSEGPEPW